MNADDLRAGVRPGLRPVAPALLVAALEATAEAIVLCCAEDDRVLLANAAARELLAGRDTLPPFVEPGTDTFEVAYRGRTLAGRRRVLDAEHYVWYLRDLTAETAREQALVAERARSAFLDEASRRLSATLNQDRCVRTTAELAIAHLADAAIVVLPAHGRKVAAFRLVRDGRGEPLSMVEEKIAEVPGLVEALAGFPPIPSRWLDPAQAPPWLLPAGFGPVGALLVTPLPGTAMPAGALVLARRGADAAFTEEDELLTRIFGARAGAAISAAALYREQVDTSAILQADLLPPELPRIEGVELVGAYQPAQDAGRVGGDFYEVFPPAGPDAETVMMLGDVCGKGARAAVLTGKVRQTLRALRLVERRPEALLDVLNQALLQPSTSHRFVTLVVGTLTRLDGNRIRLALAAGGHPAPLVLRAGGAVEEVPTHGTLIGAVPRTIVQPATVELAPGELCLLFSDGLTEARGGPLGDELWGEQRLRAALGSCRGMPADATVERLRQLVSDWVRGGTHDDIAMLAVRAPTRSAPAAEAHGRHQHGVDTTRRAVTRSRGR